MVYYILTPARNEAEHIGRTIESVASQTILPRRWVVIDDGSTDGTPQILHAAARIHPWMTVLQRRDRGFRKAGGGVIEAFEQGYAELFDVGKAEATASDWDFLVKLDGDLSFGPDYFEECFARFAAEPKLGIGGGTISILRDGHLVPECPEDVQFHVRGATKIYRRACWDQLGGLLAAPGWDTLDELKAQMLGWNTLTFPELPVQHHRPTGAADGTWKNWVKNGRANYITGYHPLFMLFKCLRRVFRRPYGVAAAGLWTGFISGYIERVPQIDDPALLRFLRQQQLRRLTFQKSLWH
jgi:poly-beta-1,6-N-acetyl-D-glucosamine synthase